MGSLPESSCSKFLNRLTARNANRLGLAFLRTLLSLSN
ncbi:hypothetical protein XHV734_3166 [Xanthomonas hortorum pv. vitians]|nr:hypothetical protein XHV734_3166 [Xanthomonas hortorum pv. vitians]